MRNPIDLLNERNGELPFDDASAKNREVLAALETLFDQVVAAPHQFDFFQLMRHIEALTPALPRLGQAPTPADEPLRLAQDVSLAFAPAALAAFTRPSSDDAVKVPRLSQRFFGLLGPNGPLPLHLTDFTRERIMHHGDATLARFLDALSHRFLLLFYRAWSQGRPVTNLDRPDADRFAFYIGSLIGFADDATLRRDAASIRTRLYFSGLVNMQTRPMAVLETLAREVLRVPVQVEPFCGHWMPLDHAERTVLSSRRIALGATSAAARAGFARLGAGAVLGAQVWDRQHKFRVIIGPLTRRQFEAFLPGPEGKALPVLVALVRQHLNRELAWDAKLVLRASSVPAIKLGKYGRLGYSTWLRSRGHRPGQDAADLALDADARVPL